MRQHVRSVNRNVFDRPQLNREQWLLCDFDEKLSRPNNNRHDRQPSPRAVFTIFNNIYIFYTKLLPNDGRRLVSSMCGCRAVCIFTGLRCFGFPKLPKWGYIPITNPKKCIAPNYTICMCAVNSFTIYKCSCVCALYVWYDTGLVFFNKLFCVTV